MRAAAKSRTVALLGEDAVKRLENSSVAVVGLGGVGGHVVETLARAGVGRLVLIDGDAVEESNLNRQIIATTATVGMPKAHAAKERVHSINPLADVEEISSRLTKANVGELIGEVDYIADCIDSLADKVALVCFACEKGIPVISACGAGNRSGLCDFEIADVYKTQYDPLARKLRGMLKNAGVKKLDVCYTRTVPEKTAGVASVPYNPAACGIKMGGYIVLGLINGIHTDKNRNSEHKGDII